MTRTVLEMVKAHPELWKTEAKFMNFLRGGIRRGLWEKHPVKLMLKKKLRYKAPLGKSTKSNPQGMVWALTCEHCRNEFRENGCQVDHKIGESSLKTLADLEAFVRAQALVLEADLQILCKECHQAKTYAERYGLTMEAARIARVVIEFGKMPAERQKQVLEQELISPAPTAEKRKEQYRKFLNGVRE